MFYPMITVTMKCNNEQYFFTSEVLTAFTRNSTYDSEVSLKYFLEVQITLFFSSLASSLVWQLICFIYIIEEGLN